MISVERAHQQAKDLINSGDPNRSLVVMSTPFKLACLNMHMVLYADALKDVKSKPETMGVLSEIHDDIQRVIMQILQQEAP